MDSESRAFESGFEPIPANTPLPCPRRMVPQNLSPVTPGQLLLGLIAFLVPASMQRAPAVIKRRA